jgi:hypothetical protein
MMKKAGRPNRKADYAAVYRMNVIYIVVKKENLRRQSYVIAVTDRHDSANGFLEYGTLRSTLQSTSNPVCNHP